MEGCGWGSFVQKNPWTVKKFIAQSKDTKPVIFAESFVDDSLGKIILFFFNLSNIVSSI